MHAVVQTIQQQLPPLLTHTLVGIYCYGSLVWGDFDPDISDIDLLVVLRQDVDKELFDTLDAFHQTLEA